MVGIIRTIRLGASVLLLMPSCSLLTRNHRNTNLGIHCGCVGFARAHDTDRYIGRNNRDNDDDNDDGDESSFKEQHSKDKDDDNDSGGETSGGPGIKNDDNDQNNNNFFGEEYSLVTTLEDVWSVLKLFVPNRNTDGYTQPEANIVADFERIVLDMMTIGQRYEHGDRRGEEKKQNSSSNINSNGNIKSNNKLGHGIGLLESHSHLHPPPRSCDQIDLRSLKGKYRIGTFVDGDNGRSYCILATTSMSYPWGSVIIDLDPSSATKNLSFDCPHPKFDAETGEQGIRLLKGTTSRSWIVAGSHRMANSKNFGTCQPQFSYYPSDAAHSVHNCFLAAVAAIKFYYESIVHQDYTSVQLHGMGKTTCGSIDTFFSHGSCSDTIAYEPDIASASGSATKSSNRNIIGVGMTEKIEILQKIALAHPFDHGQHVIANRGDNGDGDDIDDEIDDGSSSSGGGCKLCGSTNIQGRLINGVARKDLCDTFASSYNGRFVQIEQKRDYRRESRARFWNDVFNEAYPQFLRSAPATAAMATTDGDCYGDYCDEGADDTTNNNDSTQDEGNMPLSDFILFNLMLQFLL